MNTFPSVNAINFQMFNFFVIVSSSFHYSLIILFRLVVWCLWSIQSKRNVLYSGTKPGQTERDKVALLQRAQLLLTFCNHDDPPFGFLKARSQEQFTKTTKKSGDATRWETAWKLLEQNHVSPFRQQVAVLWNQQSSWLWTRSLLSSQSLCSGWPCSCGAAVEDATHCHAFKREGTAQLPALQTTAGSYFGTMINRVYFR